MKVAIIGAGNMGGAIARGLAKGTLVNVQDITVSNPSNGKLEKLRAECPGIRVSNDNDEAIREADIIILAVKPWLVEQVLTIIHLDADTQILVSVASGISFDRLAGYVGPEITMFRVIPNTAISQMESMNLIARRNAGKEQEQLIMDIFNEMGLSMLLPEEKMSAASSLSSCGTAFVMKYIQASLQAGIELGLTTQEALTMTAQCVKGAGELILQEHTHPSVEIDKVTTPGGVTIRGINELDHAGFTSAVIRALKATLDE